MNTLRTTEKSLALLLKTRSHHQKRFFQRKTFDHILKCPRNNVYRVPTIKCQEVVTKPQIRSFSDISILNPERANPEEAAKELKPIVPLSISRFPKRNLDVPSVTKVLQDTMPAASRFLLERWKEAMIRKLGVQGFSKYQAETFERGRLLHALIASYLMGRGENQAELSKEIVQNLWKSIQTVVRDKISNVRLVEHIVTHPKMNYRGIVDCVAFFEDELVVIDFKTAEKPKKNIESLYDNPLQVTAYCGAINNDLAIPQHVVDRNICSGVVIVAYIDGSEASVYQLSREKVVNDYWKEWISRLDQFSRMQDLKKNSEKLTR